MNADHRARVLQWGDCVNVRDLGGLPTTDGRSIRWGALVRADLLCRLTPSGRASLREHGVRTVIDLRIPLEIERDPNPFAQPEEGGGPLYLHMPLLASAVVSAVGPAAGYCLALDALQRDIARVAAAIADAPDGCVLIHCHAGKDRTGMVAAVLLSLVGVADQTIVEDYVVLGDLEGLAREWARWIVNFTQDPMEQARLMRGAPPDPAVMAALLSHLHARHGGAEAYLRAGGLTDREIARLRERLVEER